MDDIRSCGTNFVVLVVSVSFVMITVAVRLCECNLSFRVCLDVFARASRDDDRSFHHARGV
jgi:hypothetical protein